VGEQPDGVVRTPRESLAEASRLLSNGRPFHAHEVLEDAWKSGPAAERELWRGLAQLAVGMTHAARGNPVGGARLIERGAKNIAPYAAARPHGLDISALLAWSVDAVAAIARESPVMLPPPPLGS
jgi:predicted metal-dependent hydrolase